MEKLCFQCFTSGIKVSLIMRVWSHSKTHRFRTGSLGMPDGFLRNLELNKTVVAEPRRNTTRMKPVLV